MARTSRVLLIGRRPRVLDQLADALRRLGLEVREETDLDRVRNIDGSTIDLVAFGRGVTGTPRAAIIRTLRARNPTLRVVDGLAPITAVLVAQVQEALATPPAESRIVASAGVDPSDRRVLLTLRRAAHVTIDLHRIDNLYRAHQERVHDGRLDRGRHVLSTRSRMISGERFLVVRADDQATVHPVA